jgi:dolichol kinase
MTNELYRQAVHLVTGVLAATCVLLLSRPVFLLVWGALVLLAVLVAAVPSLASGHLWSTFERRDVAFRGKGALFFLLGIWLTAAAFWEHAFPALLLLAIPDALATALAPFVHGPRLPWNHRKSVWGSSVFLASAFAILLPFVPVAGAFLIALLLAAIESFDYREIPFLDDNIVIPLVAGFLFRFI